MKYVWIGAALLILVTATLSLVTQISTPAIALIDSARKKEEILKESVFPLNRSEFFRAEIPSGTYKVLESTQVQDSTLVEGKEVAVQKYRFQCTRTARCYEVTTSLGVARDLKAGNRILVTNEKAEIQPEE